MSIDSFDWIHRTGRTRPTSRRPSCARARRPGRSSTRASSRTSTSTCSSSYEDPDEVDWVNEGLSDWAQTLTGYAFRPRRSPRPASTATSSASSAGSPSRRPRTRSRAECGPENSLTRWLDQGAAEILADYGAAYSFMELLQNRYGTDFMTALHRDDGERARRPPGRARRAGGHGTKGHGKVMAQDVLHDWSLAVALDGLVDGDGYHLNAGTVTKKDVTVKTLDTIGRLGQPACLRLAGRAAERRRLCPAPGCVGRLPVGRRHRLALVQRLDDAAAAARSPGRSTATRPRPLRQRGALLGCRRPP